MKNQRVNMPNKIKMLQLLHESSILQMVIKPKEHD